MKTNLTIALLDDLESELAGKESDIAQAIADDINREVDESQRTMFDFMKRLHQKNLIGANLLNVVQFWFMASQDNSFKEMVIHNDARQSFGFVLLKNEERGIHKPRKIKFTIYRRFFSAKWLRSFRKIEHSEILPTPAEVEKTILDHTKINGVMS